jgi:hypothetical protein
MDSVSESAKVGKLAIEIRAALRTADDQRIRAGQLLLEARPRRKGAS